MISFIYTLIAVPTNIVNYLGALSLPAPPDDLRSIDAKKTRSVVMIALGVLLGLLASLWTLAAVGAVRAGMSARRAALLIFVAIGACRSPQLTELDGGDYTPPRRGGPPLVDARSDEEQWQTTLQQLQQQLERERTAYVALPPTAAPAGSTFRTCPDNYGLAIEPDGGSYCGKLCKCTLCDQVDAGVCCGTHRCDRKATSWSPIPRDGPAPIVCSP